MHQRVLPAQARGQSACGPKMPATTIETHMHIHMRNGSNATQHNPSVTAWWGQSGSSALARPSDGEGQGRQTDEYP